MSPHEITLRSTDFDPYGHVGASRYFDFVDDALWDSARRQEDEVNPTITQASIEYRRPISKGQRVWVHSSAVGADHTDKTFVIAADDADHVFARGSLQTGANPAPAPVQVNPPGAIDQYGTPTIFDSVVSTRFDDFSGDPGLSLGRCCDLVLAARCQSFREDYDLTVNGLHARQIGTFVTKWQTAVHEPVDQVQRLRIRSWVDAVARQGTVLSVRYQIDSVSDQHSPSRIFQTGHFDLAIVDTSGTKPQRMALPEWFSEMLFEPAHAPA